MDLLEMREKVQSEMARIPTWPKPQQSFLRAHYWLVRMNSLGKKAEKPGMTAYEALQECIEFLKSRYPDSEFQYDKQFFKPKKRKDA